MSQRGICDLWSRQFQGTAPKVEKPNVVRIVLDIRYNPVKNSTVRSRVVSFLRSHQVLTGAKLRAIRVEMGHTRDCNCDWDTTVVHVAVNLPAGRDSRDACLQLTKEFYTVSSAFSTSSKAAYAVREVTLLYESTFLALVYSAPMRSSEGKTLLGFTARWRDFIPGGEEELEKVWACQLLRQDVADALELPREVVRVCAIGDIPLFSDFREPLLAPHRC